MKFDEIYVRTRMLSSLFRKWVYIAQTACVQYAKEKYITVKSIKSHFIKSVLTWYNSEVKSTDIQY